MGKFDAVVANLTDEMRQRGSCFKHCHVKQARTDERDPLLVLFESCFGDVLVSCCFHTAPMFPPRTVHEHPPSKRDPAGGPVLKFLQVLEA